MENTTFFLVKESPLLGPKIINFRAKNLD